MSEEKKYTEEQHQKLLAKEVAKGEKAVAAAVKAETKRVLEVIKEFLDANKEVEDKAIKTHVANTLKELQASVKQ